MRDFKDIMHQIRLRYPAGGDYSASPDPLAVLKGAYFRTSKVA